MSSVSISNDQSKMQVFILLFGIAEMCVGFSGVILADFIPAFNPLVVITGVTGLVALAFCITHPTNLKVYDVLGMALVFSYGTGALNSLISYALDNKDLLHSSSVPEYWLTRTLGFSFAAAGFLHVVGRFESKGYLFYQIDSIDLQSKRTLWFVVIIAMATVLFVVTGRIGFMGALSENGSSHVSISASVLFELMSPTGAFALYAGLKEKQSKRQFIFLLLSFTLLLVQFGLGRRVFVFSVLMYLMTAILAKRPKRYFSLKNIVVLISAVMLIQFVTTGYFVMRSARSYFGKQYSPSIVELVPKAITLYQDRERLHLAEQIHENVGSRSFVLEYLALMSSRESKIEPTYGVNLLRAAVVAMPSVFYPSKYRNPLFGPEEELENVHFRLPVWDAANSVLTAGVDDFGSAGFFILPVFFCVIFSFLLRIFRSLLPPVAGMLISFFVFKAVLSVEEDIVSYFTLIRSMAMFFVFYWLIFAHKRSLSRQTSVLSMDSVARKI